MTTKDSSTHPFAVGSWITDPQHKRLCGGSVLDGRGGIRFEPSSGEVVALLRHKTLGKAYKVNFGGSTNVLLADKCICYQCGAPDDQSHLEGCVSAPCGYLRVTSHEPGFCP